MAVSRAVERLTGGQGWRRVAPVFTCQGRGLGRRSITPAQAGGLLTLTNKDSVPPAPPPAPVLEPQDILQQQLPVCPNDPMFRTFRCRLAPKETATGKPEYNINMASLDG